MNKLLIVLAIAFTLCITGCTDNGSQIPPGSFRAKVEFLVESSDILVKHMTIEASGKRTVKVTEKGGLSKATIEPVQNTDIMFAEVTIVAALVKTPESGTMIKWLIQIKGEGVTVGGPSTFSVEAGSLADVLELSIDEGFYQLGQDIIIGKFQGDPIILTVK